MLNRRSFFQSIAKAAAIVALAPQLAFRVKPVQFDPEEVMRVLMHQYEANAIRFQMTSFYDFMMSQEPHTREEMLAREIGYKANMAGPEIRSIPANELRAIFNL